MSPHSGFIGSPVDSTDFLALFPQSIGRDFLQHGTDTEHVDGIPAWPERKIFPVMLWIARIYLGSGGVLSQDFRLPRVLGRFRGGSHSFRPIRIHLRLAVRQMVDLCGWDWQCQGKHEPGSPLRQQLTVCFPGLQPRFVEYGITPSVGNAGDSYDNVLAESVNGPHTGHTKTN